MKLELYFPVKPWVVTQNFGENQLALYASYGLKGHNGMDIRAYHGQPVYSAHDGEVVYAGADSSEGWGVVVRTLEPRDYNGGTAYIKSIYWHIIKTIPVKVGQKVKAGDLIGYADNTGASTGDHLHFGIKPQSKGENDWTWWNTEQANGYNGAINPAPYFNNYYAQDAQLVLGIYRKIIELLKLAIR